MARPASIRVGCTLEPQGERMAAAGGAERENRLMAVVAVNWKPTDLLSRFLVPGLTVGGGNLPWRCRAD